VFVEFYDRVAAAFAIQLSDATQDDAAFAHYTEVGQSLVNDQIVQDLIGLICDARNKATQHHHFYFVNAHSGMGKTQLPFAFKAAPQMKVCHLIMTENVRQPIYTPLEPLSDLFRSVLTVDLENFSASHQSFESTSIANSYCKYSTVGFIFSIMGVSFDDSRPWTAVHLATHIQKLDKAVKANLPIFFLDEVLPHLEDRDSVGISDATAKLRLARNFLCAVGLVGVLMGTNSSAANTTQAASGSRGPQPKWCYLITQLPRPNETSLNRLGVNDLISRFRNIQPLSTICPFLNQQFAFCTPWFIELFVKFANTVLDRLNHPQTAPEFLDAVLSGMAQEVYQQKALYHKIGLQAQFCLHLDDCKQLDDSSGQVTRVSQHNPCIPELTSSFVAAHFASLNDADCWLYLARINMSTILSKEPNGANWNAPALFKRPIHDCFLYLMLCDGNLRYPFPKPFAVSTQTNRTTFEAHNMVNGETIRGRNQLASKRSGEALEIGAAVAVEIASHRGGLGGILFQDFILQLATEMFYSPRNLQWMNPPVLIPLIDEITRKRNNEGRNLLDAIKDKKIPYLSCAGDSWPNEFKNIVGVEWGELRRLHDQERVDMKIYSRENDIDPPIAVECKNYESNLPLKILKGILQRINAHTWFHIVICTHLQDEYFQSRPSSTRSWESYKNRINFQSTAIFKVVILENTLSLQPLFLDSVPASYNRVVVFFPTEDWPTNETTAAEEEEETIQAKQRRKK
jgi:hypothetical protein